MVLVVEAVEVVVVEDAAVLAVVVLVAGPVEAEGRRVLAPSLSEPARMRAPRGGRIARNVQIFSVV